MNLYRMEDRFDTKTGKKLKPIMTQVGVICDFTGKEAQYSEDLGVIYELNYSSIDPCGGCGEGEYEFSKKWKIEIHDFLFVSPYIFDDEDSGDGKTTMEKMLETAKEEGFDRMYFDQLFRWCRIRTADRLLSEGKYTKEELGMETADWMEDEDDEDED